MKRWIVAALLILAGPAHAASEAGALLRALMLDAKDPVLRAWAFEAEAAQGVSWTEDEPQWSEERKAYARTGRVELAWPGAEGTRLEGFGWHLALIGGRAGPTQLEIDSIGNMPELGGGLPELKGLELAPRLCDEDESTLFGMKVYTVEAPGKQPAFLRHEWSCGSAGCSVMFRLYLHEREIRDYERGLREEMGMVPCDQVAEKKPTITYERRIHGAVFNANSGASAGVAMGFAVRSDGIVLGSVVFDNKNLFGRFEAIGAGAMCQADAHCYQLEGEFIVGGDDGSGFPPDTRTRFVITYTISGDQVRGVYHIGRLPGVDREQHGTLEGQLLQ